MDTAFNLTLDQKGHPMQIWEIANREQIRELVARYTHLGDGGRIKELVDLFEPDATLNANRIAHTGHEAINGFFGAIANGSSGGRERSFIRHYISNLTIQLTSETTATGASYWTVISDIGLESSGRYRDEYHCDSDGLWRFSSRIIRSDESKLPPV